MRFIHQHETIQKYDAILPDSSTNQAMKESEAYKTYYYLANGKATPKPNKRLKATAKVAKLGKKKQPAQGLETLSEIALSEAEQMKIALERSKTQQHTSHASGSGIDEGTGVKLGVPDVPSYDSEDEQISWKSSDNEGDDDASKSKDDKDDIDDDDQDDADNDSERTESDNDDDEFVHPKFTTHNEEDKEEESFDLRVQTPSHYESTDDEAYDDVAQSGNAEEEKMDEEQTNEEDKVLKRRDTEMTDAPPANMEANFIDNLLNPNPDTGIDSILKTNVESTSFVEVPVTTQVEIPSSSATTLPPPPIPLIQPPIQTPFPIPTTTPSTSLQDLPNFGSLFGFDNRLKTLEANFSEFKQTNQFATALFSIPNIVDNYLGSKLKDAVDVAVQLKFDKLRDEAQVENQDFINQNVENINKIIKEQVKIQVKEQINKILPRIEKSVNEQLEAELLIRSSNKAQTSHAIADDSFRTHT
ncbi:hypothetical protein Tco_0367055 [Tanacetum coccineum]